MGCHLWGRTELDVTVDETRNRGAYTGLTVRTKFGASLVAQTVKRLPAMLETRVPGSGRSPGEGNGNPLLYSCLENSMDRGALYIQMLISFVFSFAFHFSSFHSYL